MTGAIVAHLWQSTLFAGAAALLALTFRANQARVRYWIWLAALPRSGAIPGSANCRQDARCFVHCGVFQRAGASADFHHIKRRLQAHDLV